jgi:hypothetical protein
VLNKDVTWVTKLSNKFSKNLLKIGMLQLKFINFKNKMDKIEFENLNNSNEIQGRNEKQKKCVMEIENEKN